MQVALFWLLSFSIVTVTTAAGVRHVKLRKHVTRRQRHLAQIRGVPRAQDDAAVVRVRAQLVHHLGELVDALARVVGGGIDVRGAKVAPLEPVDGAQVALGAVPEPCGVEEGARAVAVPDLDALLAEGQRRGRARDEPEELGEDGLVEDALGGQEGVERRAGGGVEGEFERARGKEGVGACASSVLYAKVSVEEDWGVEGRPRGWLTGLAGALPRPGSRALGRGIGIPRVFSWQSRHSAWRASSRQRRSLRFQMRPSWCCSGICGWMFVPTNEYGLDSQREYVARCCGRVGSCQAKSEKRSRKTRPKQSGRPLDASRVNSQLLRPFSQGCGAVI